MRASPPRRQNPPDSVKHAKSSAASGALATAGEVADLPLRVVERQVADVLAVNHVDRELADILGVIADTLECAHHPHDFQRAPDRARILHHESDVLALDRLVFLVDLAVAARHLERLVRLEAGKGMQCIVHHFGDQLAQVADLAVIVGRLFHGREACRDVADLLNLVTDALEVRDRLDDRDHHAQVRRSRLAGRDDAAALLVDLDLHLVDAVVVPRHFLAERAVAIDQRLDRELELLLDEAAHLHHARADTFHVLVEPPRRVLTQVSRFHDRTPRRRGPATASYQCWASRAGTPRARATAWRTSSPLTRKTTCSATFLAWSPMRSRLFRANTVSKTGRSSRVRSMATVMSCRSAASNSSSIARSSRATSCASAASPRSSASTATRMDSEASSAMCVSGRCITRDGPTLALPAVAT